MSVCSPPASWSLHSAIEKALLSLFVAERKQISRDVCVSECECICVCMNEGERLANMDSRFSSPQWLCKGMKGLHQGKEP